MRGTRATRASIGSWRIVVTALVAVAGLVLAAPASAYRRDMHYDAKFAVAVAAGWSWVDARMIASADMAIDVNHDTTDASLAVGSNGVEQAPQNYRFHCFSHQNDQQAVEQGTYNQDVADQMAALEKEADDAIAAASSAEKAGSADQYALATRARIAIGVYLHCQEDAWSHGGAGGTSWGHALGDLLGESPDIPARRPERTRGALTQSHQKLAKFMQEWHGQATVLTPDQLEGLITVMTRPVMAGMRDARRMDCASNMIGHWLYGTLVAQGRLQATIPGPSAVAPMDKPTGDCGEWFTDAFGPFNGDEKQIVLPRPIYPALDANGHPTGVQPAGSYNTVPEEGPLDFHIQGVVAAIVPPQSLSKKEAIACEIEVKTKVVNDGKVTSPATKVGTAIEPVDNKTGTEPAKPKPVGGTETLPPIKPHKTKSVSDRLRWRGKCPKQAVAVSFLESTGRGEVNTDPAAMDAAGYVRGTKYGSKPPHHATDGAPQPPSVGGGGGGRNGGGTGSGTGTGNCPSTDLPPQASSGFSPNSPPSAPKADQAVVFDGSGSNDPDGTVTGLGWGFGGPLYGGGGTPSMPAGTGATASVTFSAPGVFPVTLTATDNCGKTNAVTQNVKVSGPGSKSGIWTTNPTDSLGCSGMLTGYIDIYIPTYAQNPNHAVGMATGGCAGSTMTVTKVARQSSNAPANKDGSPRLDEWGQVRDTYHIEFTISGGTTAQGEVPFTVTWS